MDEETREMNPSFNLAANPGTIAQDNRQAVSHVRADSYPMNGLLWTR
jgi:hypothetical protein